MEKHGEKIRETTVRVERICKRKVKHPKTPIKTFKRKTSTQNCLDNVNAQSEPF